MTVCQIRTWRHGGGVGGEGLSVSVEYGGVTEGEKGSSRVSATNDGAHSCPRAEKGKQGQKSEH